MKPVKWKLLNGSNIEIIEFMDGINVVISPNGTRTVIINSDEEICDLIDALNTIRNKRIWDDE